MFGNGHLIRILAGALCGVPPSLYAPVHDTTSKRRSGPQTSFEDLKPHERTEGGAHTWNAWRKAHTGIVPDLFKADLSKADLASDDATGANLYRADLTNANLLGTNLHGVNLRNANLAGATLGFTLFGNTNLTD